MYKLRSYNVIHSPERLFEFEEAVKFETYDEIMDYLYSRRKNENDSISTSSKQKIDKFFDGDIKSINLRYRSKNNEGKYTEVYRNVVLEKEITDFDGYLLINRSFAFKGNIKKDRDFIQIIDEENYIYIVNNEIERFNTFMKNKVSIKIDDLLSPFITFRSPLGCLYYNVTMEYLTKEEYVNSLLD